MHASNFQKLIILNFSLSIIVVLAEELILGNEFYQAIPEHLESKIIEQIMSGYYGSFIQWSFIALAAATFVAHMLAIVLCYLFKKWGRVLFIWSSLAAYCLASVWGDTIRIGYLEILYLAENATFAVLAYAMYYTDLKNEFL